MAAIYRTIHNIHRLPRVVSIIIGIMLSVPVIVAGVYFVQKRFSTASDYMPHDVIISKIDSTKATVSWSTDQEVQAVIEYGTSPAALVYFAPEAKKTKDHQVDLSLLTPRTSHYFQIRINNQVFDDGGSPWSFTTKGADSGGQSTGGEPTPTFGVGVITPTRAKVVTSTPAAACTETDCQKIRLKLGYGCSAADYVKCIMTVKTATGSPTLAPTTTSSSSSAVDADNSTVTANETAVPANGSNTSLITVTLKNSARNVVSGKRVTLASNITGTGAPTITTVIGTTNSSGVATFSVKSITSGPVIFTATDASDNLTINQTASVTFTAGTVNKDKSTVVANPLSVRADGNTSATITVTLKDSNSNPVSGKKVTLSTTGSATITPDTYQTTDSLGQVNFKVTSTTAGGPYTFTAKDTTDSTNVITITDTASVTFTSS